jgi:nitrilase
MQPVTVAAVQATPVILDRAATIEKACDLIAEAARNGARLVVFPEAFVPTYPDWAWAVPPSNHAVLDALYAELLDQSVTVSSPATDRLGKAAAAAGAYVVIGINERNASASNGSLYNSLLYFGPDGRILGTHRKLVPTGAERLIWAQGDGSTLDVYDTPFGRLSGLICWENYMPLARYSLFAWGTQIYIAATWDRGEPWLSTLRHIAKEGRVYVIGCGMPMRTSDAPERLRQLYAADQDWINGGDSAIVDPNGFFVAGPLHKAEGILYATLDPAKASGSRWMLDVAGHYARPDVFRLSVDRSQRPILEALASPRQALEIDAMGAAGNDHDSNALLASALVHDGQHVAVVETGQDVGAPADR